MFTYIVKIGLLTDTDLASSTEEAYTEIFKKGYLSSCFNFNSNFGFALDYSKDCVVKVFDMIDQDILIAVLYYIDQTISFWKNAAGKT